MSRTTSYLLSFSLGLLVVSGCNGTTDVDTGPPEGDQPGTAPFTPESFEATVVETMNSGGYTYVLVDDGTRKIWAAAPQTSLATGDEIVVPAGMWMKGFHSKTLDRKFDWILFVGGLGSSTASTTPTTSDTDEMPPGHPDVSGGPTLPAGHPSTGGEESPEPEDIDLSGIERAKDGQTVEEIYTQRADLAGKSVRVRGKVVKFTQKILGTNWIHLRDGTGDMGTNDLTVTTAATVSVGDTIVVEGTLAVDRDFGAGYRYSAIVEEAKIVVE